MLNSLLTGLLVEDGMKRKRMEKGEQTDKETRPNPLSITKSAISLSASSFLEGFDRGWKG